MGSCQNYGPFLGTLNIRCRIIIRTQKGTRIFTTSQMNKSSLITGKSMACIGLSSNSLGMLQAAEIRPCDLSLATGKNTTVASVGHCKTREHSRIVPVQVLLASFAQRQSGSSRYNVASTNCTLEFGLVQAYPGRLLQRPRWPDIRV